MRADEGAQQYWENLQNVWKAELQKQRLPSINGAGEWWYVTVYWFKKDPLEALLYL